MMFFFYYLQMMSCGIKLYVIVKNFLQVSIVFVLVQIFIFEQLFFLVVYYFSVICDIDRMEFYNI